MLELYSLHSLSRVSFQTRCVAIFVECRWPYTIRTSPNNDPKIDLDFDWFDLRMNENENESDNDVSNTNLWSSCFKRHNFYVGRSSSIFDAKQQTNSSSHSALATTITEGAKFEIRSNTVKQAKGSSR